MLERRRNALLKFAEEIKVRVEMKSKSNISLEEGKSNNIRVSTLEIETSLFSRNIIVWTVWTLERRKTVENCHTVEYEVYDYL